jgi:glycosyltransferase involved in cell wall biosynthesis
VIASFLNRRTSSSGRREPSFASAEQRKGVPTCTRPRQVARDLARLAWWKCWNAYFYRRARQELLRERPDFLYERYVRGASSGIRLARELDVPLIVEMNTSFTFPGEWWERHSPLTPWAVRRAEERLTSAADRVIVVSSNLRDYLVAAGVSDEKVVVMFNGTDSRRFRPDVAGTRQLRARYGLQKSCVIGFIGSLKPWHGVDVLIKGFKRCYEGHPDLRLLIVGDGPLRGALEGLTRDLGIAESVVFTGAVPYEEVPIHVASLDIAVCPAPGNPNHHLSPIKLFEYMAAARPTIAARFSDIPKIIRDHETGILVEPGDEADLGQAVAELIGDQKLASRIGREARRDVEESFSWRRNAERVLELYREVERTNAVGPRGKRRPRSRQARDRTEMSAVGRPPGA